MKSIKIFALFGLLSLIFMGCPYQTKYTLGDSSNAIADASLTGKFEDKDGYKYKVELTGSIYMITKKDKEGKNDPSYYKGFVVSLGDANWLNLYEVDKDGNPTATDQIEYYLYKVEKMDGSGSVIKLRGVTKNITEDFESATELRDFVKKNMNISFFYDKDEEILLMKTK